MRVLYIIKEEDRSKAHGSAIISKRNYELLKDSADVDIHVLHLEYNCSILEKTKRKLCGIGRGISQNVINELFDRIFAKNYDVIYINWSYYGYLCKKIHQKFPTLKIIVFFHGVEYNFLKAMIKGDFFPKKIINLFYMYRAEQMTVKYAHKIIVLNDRDSNELHKLYGREADLILPTSFKDINTGVALDNFTFRGSGCSKSLKLLFVGSNFFANIEGLSWFIKNVMSQITCADLYVVGKDMEKIVLPHFSNVHIIGTVEDLNEWYYHCDVVVLPIFSGSGMKTKTAEALMFGKPMLGTLEAFEGYSIEYHKVGGLCQSAEEFISKIIYFSQNRNQLKVNGKYARSCFLELYLYDKSLLTFKEFLSAL